ncbi:MAG: UrcA family protein [Gammaproteobacteria bacterium]
MRHFVTSRAKLALLLVAGALGAGAASAGSLDTDVPGLVVRYSSEALTTHAGVKDLYRRIQFAAKKVCPEASIRDLRSIGVARVCREQAVANAIHQINNSQLAALNATSSKSG